MRSVARVDRCGSKRGSGRGRTGLAGAAAMNTVSMPSSALDAAWYVRFCQDLFGSLRVATFDGVGITRESFGGGESTALDIVGASARKVGLPTERDLGANLVVTRAGTEPALPFLACGSHLDSV